MAFARLAPELITAIFIACGRGICVRCWKNQCLSTDGPSLSSSSSSIISLTSSSSTSTDTSKAGRKEKTERRSVPWSIIAILAVSITTTLPWAAMMLFEVEVTEMLAEGGDISVLFDLFYSLLQVLISCSPLVYLLTTNSLRLIVFRKIRNIFK